MAACLYYNGLVTSGQQQPAISSSERDTQSTTTAPNPPAKEEGGKKSSHHQPNLPGSGTEPLPKKNKGKKEIAAGLPGVGKNKPVDYK